MIQPDARPYLWMLCGSFSFAVMAVLTESLTRRTSGAPPVCDWQTVVVFRAALVTLFAAALARRARVRFVWLRPGRLWLRSVAGSGSMVCTFYAFGHLNSDAVVTLSNTFPLWVALLSWPLSGRPPGGKHSSRFWSASPGSWWPCNRTSMPVTWGVFVALAAAAFTAVAMLGLHRLQDIDPRAVVVHFSAVATVFCGAAFLVTPRAEPLERVAEVGVVVRLLGIGVSATIGQVFLTLAFGRGAPAKLSVVGLTQIVFVTAMGGWAFDRAVNGVALLGTALIMAPTAWLLSQSKVASGTKKPVDPTPEGHREPEHGSAPGNGSGEPKLPVQGPSTPP